MLYFLIISLLIFSVNNYCMLKVNTRASLDFQENQNISENLNESFLSAVYENNKNLVEDLLKYGVDINYKNKFGWNALHLATVNRYKDIIKLLINYGVDINSKTSDDQNYTALHLAVLYDYLDIIEILVKASNINLDPKDRYGVSPLSIAIGAKKSDIARLLINKDTDIERALRTAKKSKAYKIILILLAIKIKKFL